MVPLRQVRHVPGVAPLLMVALLLLAGVTSGGAASDRASAGPPGPGTTSDPLVSGDGTCTGVGDPPPVAREAGTQEPASGPLGPVAASCAGRISPGARIATATGMCSLGFILRDDAGAWYATTAGHCVEAVGAPVAVPSIGDIGVVVYRIAAGIGTDFALLRIDDEDVDAVDPAMCHWGGPTGTATQGQGLVRHYGFGTLHDATTFSRARSGVTHEVEAEHFTFLGTVASGDSGAAVRLADGGALGIITNVNLRLQGLAAHSAPFVYGTTLTHGVALAEADLGVDLTLQTAPVADTI